MCVEQNIPGPCSAMQPRTLDNDLITHHNNHILIFDLQPPGQAEVEYVCDVKGAPGSANYQYLCKGAHRGGPISLIVFGIRDDRDEYGWCVAYDRIEWADTRAECDDSLVLDTYLDLIRDDLEEIIRETWH
jgi:hypothetical protein